MEAFCKELARLLPTEKIGALRQRWLRENQGAAADAGQFCQWLVTNHVVTEYQAGVLSRGHADRLFIGQYTVMERVGKGRMAGVYKAVDTLGQIVALKILPPSKAKNPELLARFQRESRLALQLHHPNLVRTLQTGEEQGLHFIVMEYLEGELLEEALQRRKRLDPREAVRIVYQALQGLQHLHEQAMVHRDLKPGNLMLLPADRQEKKATMQRGRVKILDVGLGLGLFVEEEGEGNEFQLTNEGTLLGTPDYLAPEQARDAHAVNIRADIYSLGCVLYHALTGQPPFPDTSRIRQLVRHATETPLPLKTLNPAIPDGLQPLVDRMLAKDPARRYATPHEAALALRGFLAAKDARGRVSGKATGKAAPPAAPSQPSVRTSPPLASSVPIPIALPVAVPTRAAPALPLPANQGIALAPAVDVELVTAAPGGKGLGGPNLAAGWSRRDWLIFAFGAAVGSGAVLALGGLGLLLAKLLRRPPREPEEPAPADSGGAGATVD